MHITLIPILNLNIKIALTNFRFAYEETLVKKKNKSAMQSKCLQLYNNLQFLQSL